MKQMIKNIAALLLLAAVCMGTMKLAPTITGGIEMYKEAEQQVELSEYVQTARTKSGYTQLSDIPEGFLSAVVKSEDKRFFYHIGIDPIAIARAAYNNLRAGHIVQGGSTITQQLAKNIYFSFERDYSRKIAEIFASMHIESMYTKDEILEIYLNVIYFGENCYGIGDASEHYYGVEPKMLTEEQIDALVLTIKCPNEYNPNALRAQAA